MSQIANISTEERPLSEMQLAFVREYCIDPSSATAAAKRAGYSIDTAPQAASRLMADSRVKEAIRLAQETRAKAIGISTERVLQELAKIAFADVGDNVLIEDDEIDLSKLRGSATEIVINTSKSGGRKSSSTSVKTVKLADKLSALVKLGQHLGMFKDASVEVNLTLDKLIEQSFTSEPKENEGVH